MYIASSCLVVRQADCRAIQEYAHASILRLENIRVASKKLANLLYVRAALHTSRTAGDNT